MKNILKHFVNLSVGAHASMENIVRHLELFKNTSTYRDVVSFYQQSKNDDVFMKNYISSEYGPIYSTACADLKKITFKKVVKQIIR